MVKTSDLGRQAESAVARELERRGHKIISMNWRRRRGEIDIISLLNDTVYFTEVKFRSSANQGEGFDYITTAKRRQMELAAQLWLSENNWSGECQLLAASVSGQNSTQIDIVEI